MRLIPNRAGPDRNAILRSLPILASVLTADFVLYRLLPGVDTGAHRTLRYAPFLALSASLFILGVVLMARRGRGFHPEAAPAAASHPISSLYWAFLVLGVAGSVFFSYLVGKVLVFRLDHESVWKDTVTYAAVAEAPITSNEFWAGERSFTLPLLYKTLGVDQTNLGRLSSMRHISAFQFLLGVLSWTVLAAVSGSLVSSRTLKLLGFGVILALGMTLDVSLWDRVLLTESISTSLLVLLLAMALLGLRNTGRFGRHGSWWQIPYGVALCVLCVLYSFTRDTNAYFLGICALAIMASMAFASIRRHSSASAWIAVALFFLTLFVVQSASANRGRRWVTPYINILYIRIFPDREARTFFESAGMPTDEVTLDIFELDRFPFMQALKFNYGANPLFRWVETNGKVTYIRYLLSRPLDSFMTPIDRARNLISPVSTEYRADDYSVPIWLRLFSRFFFPLPLAIVVVWSGVVIVWLVALGRRGQFRPVWAAPALLLLTAFPMMYVVWYADAIEVERHAFQISLQIRLALWMISLFMLDYGLGRLAPSAAEVDSGPAVTGRSGGVPG